MKSYGVLIVAAIVGLVTVSAAMAQEPAGKEQPFPAALSVRLCYISSNFMRDNQVNDAIATMRKAAAAGYNGVFVTDCKFERWDDKVTVERPQYDQNVKKVRQAARELKLKFISSCLSQTGDLMSVNPNLAEGMPVKDAPFVVKDGKLAPGDEDCKPVNLGLEETKRPNELVGWNVDFPGKCSFVDTEVKCAGKPSLRFDDISVNSSYGNGRAFQTVKCKPWRYYHISVMIKTQDFPAVRTINITAMGKTNGLAHQLFDVKPTQDWTKYDVIINTMENDEINLALGSWGGGKGKIWFGDVQFQPGGFVNVIRRDSLTFKITSQDGATVYEEGKDFAAVRDPKLMNDPFPGAHSYWHQAPEVAIPAGSRLKEGQTVLASYSHAMNTYGWGVFACPADPETMRLACKNLHQIHTVMEPDGYMLPWDEIRHMGLDDSCVKTGKSCLELLKDNVKACQDAVRKEDPGKPMYAWNDMFDPYHNAAKKGEYFYLVKGKDPFYGSWEALDKNVIILNWQSDPAVRKQSMKHFADLGHKQILCGYYDASSDAMTSWLKDASEVKGVVGVMYTTWGQDYKELDKFLDVCRKAAGKE
jgi:hypothetical protein